MSEAQRPIELFYSYAQEDEELRYAIEKHLSHLVQQRQIMPWHQQKILPGTNRVQEIDTHLNTAQIILLLVSSDFLASDYAYHTEMQHALERHKAGSSCVIPILLRPVDWQGTPFGDLEPLPSNHKPITSWSNRDEALLDVALGIRRAVETFKKQQPVQVQQEVKPVEQPPTNQPPLIDGLDRPATVFLSYAREDTEAVKDLQLRLKIRGVRCWRDVDDMPIGSHTESEITQAIEHDSDAIALFLTPSFLQSEFIWRVEVPAALHRHERDPQFHIIPVLLGVTFAEVRQFCRTRNITDITSFNGLSLTENGAAGISREEQNKKRNEAARRILHSAFAVRLRRVNADRSYVPTLSLKTFVSAPSTDTLDLDLDWLNLVYEKERLPTLKEWDEILWPALKDVKHIISEKILSHRIHLYMKSVLPVALALGFAFRETAGITLLLERQKETWNTETRPTEDEPLHCERISNEQGDQQVGVIEVATTFPTKQSVEDTLPLIGIMPGYHIQLNSPKISRESVRDVAHAQAIAKQVSYVCRELRGQYGVRHLHLFIATPVELAVLIGHQLNALCPMTIYGIKNDESVYTPIGILRS